ncbi:MAG: PEP-CTERM sorting domain-containing protein [Roseobacter sp.]|uniref:PEP-CTERM sorting domain-containing protein n=1 Tax=Tateyamaria sp. TaxID=1929288 RepID=UPI00327ECD02
MKLTKLIGMVSLAITATTAAQAAVVMNVWEDGTDVRAQVRGSLDMSGYDSQFNSTGGSSFSQSAFLLGRDGATDVMDSYQFNSVTTPTTLGPLFSSSPPSSSLGSDFGMSFGGSAANTTIVNVDQGYTNGDTITTDSLWATETLVNMGLASGTYLFTLPRDTITIKIGEAPAVSAVPLPASAPLLAFGCGLMAWAGRRRRT